MKTRNFTIVILVSTLVGCVNNNMFRDDFKHVCTFADTDNAAENDLQYTYYDSIKKINHAYKYPQICTSTPKDYHASFGACIPQNIPKYTLPNPYHSKCRNSALQIYDSHNHNQDYHLGFIEYDDQGQLYKRGQLNSVTSYLQNLKENKKVILVVYVHGWHHTAGFNSEKIDDDTDTQKFRKLLKQLSQSETVIANGGGNPRTVVGVYLGWRGESTDIPGFSQATFWSRKNIAHRIGQLGATESLLKLEKIIYPERDSIENSVADGESAEQGNAKNEASNSDKSHMIIIGHSFGAAVVASALQKTLIDRHLSDTNNQINSLPVRRTGVSGGATLKDPVRGFAALTVLINPAFEALKFATLMDISQNYNKTLERCVRYSIKQTPRLVTLTSEDDVPTSFAFPFGRRIETIFEAHREYYRDHCKIVKINGTDKYKNIRWTDDEKTVTDQKEANVTAIGHYKPYVTHKLVSRKASLRRASIEKANLLKKFWQAQKNGAQLCFENVALKHLGKNDPFNPYLNIEVSGDIIRDHNDIWGLKLQSFIQALIRLNTTDLVERDPVETELEKYDKNCFVTAN